MVLAYRLPGSTPSKHARMARWTWRWLCLVMATLLALPLMAGAQTIGDPVAGQSLYNAQQCASCHGLPSSRQQKIQNGVDWTTIRRGINNQRDMFKYASLTDAQLKDLSAYICKDLNSTASTCNAAGPKIAASPTSLAFGNTQAGATSAAKSVTVSNTGGVALTISSIGVNNAAFTQTNNCPASLAAGASCTVSVSFVPSAATSYSGGLVIAHNDATAGSSTTIALSGTGTAAPAPVLTLSATTLSFGAQLVGQSSAPLTLTVGNSGNANLLFSATPFTVSGTNASDFSLGTSTCGGATLAPGATCQVSVAYAPLTAGSSKSATLSVANASGLPAASVALQAAAATNPAPLLQASVSALDFGIQTVGGAGVSRSVDLINNGTAAAAFGTGAFSVTQSGIFWQSNTCGTSLAVGAQCTVTVTFTPSAATPYSGTLTVSSGSSSVAVTLAGTGAAPTATAPTISLSSNALSFAAQVQNTSSAAQQLTLSNTGNDVLSVTDITIAGLNRADYAIAAGAGSCGAGAVPGAFTLATGASCSLYVVFTPQATGSSSAQLTVGSATVAGGNPVVTLAGTGLAAPTPVASLSTTLLSFAGIPAGGTSAARSVTLTNTGNATLTGSFAITGPNAGDFQVVSDVQSCALPLNLAAGASCAVYVQYRPAATGASSGSLVFSTNAAVSPTVALAGTAGTAPAAAPNLSGPAGAGVWPSTMVGSSGGQQQLTLSNDGTAAMTVGAAQVTGAAATDFTVAQNTCPAQLQPAASCTIAIDFVPTDVGARDATFSIVASGASAPLTMPLSGVGAVIASQTNVVGAPGSFAAGAGTQSGSGGCTVGNIDNGLTDPTLLVLAALAAAILLRRRLQSAADSRSNLEKTLP